MIFSSSGRLGPPGVVSGRRIADCSSSQALPQESSPRSTGGQGDERQKGTFEVSVAALNVIARPATEYPITPKDHGTDFLMDHRHLWLRSRRQHAILRVRAEIVAAIRDYFDSHDFVLVDAPIFTPNACEGTSTLFETDFHGTPAYLTQSGQLYMEAAAAAFGRVYCFGPTFRAEKSKTRRTWPSFGGRARVAFMDLAGDMRLAEDFLVSVVARVLDRKKEELKVLERGYERARASTEAISRIRYAEAIATLQQKGIPRSTETTSRGDEETVISSGFDRR